MPDTQTKTVVGKIGGVGQANENGFANIKIETDNGDLWVSSRVPGLIGIARDARGEVRAVDYVEKVSTKLDRFGQPYVNRYLEAVRQPASDEVNGNGATETDSTRTFTVAQGVTQVPGVNTLAPAPSSGNQDEFRRSKEEMRWTEALNIASRILPPGAGTIQLGELATLVEALIQERA